MKRQKKAGFISMLFLGIALVLTGCGGSGGGDRSDGEPETVQIAGLYSANAKITTDIDGQVVQTSSEDFFVRIDQEGKNVTVNLYDKEEVKAQYPILPDPLAMQCTINADRCETMSIIGTVLFQGVEIPASVPSSILSVEQNGQLTWPLEITLTFPPSASNDGKGHELDLISEFSFNRHEVSTTPSAGTNLPPATATQDSLDPQSWIDSPTGPSIDYFYNGQGCYGLCTFLQDKCVVGTDYTQLCGGGPSGLDEDGNPVQ